MFSQDVLLFIIEESLYKAKTIYHDAMSKVGQTLTYRDTAMIN